MLSLEQLAKLPPQIALWSLELFAVQYLLPVEALDVAAVLSRETNGKNIIGDNGHGFGLMQLDNRPHEDAGFESIDKCTMPDGKLLALVPAINIYLGAVKLVRNFHVAARTRPDEPRPIMFTLYNASSARVFAAAGMLTGDALVAALDAVTTGGDYCSDVLRRRKEFADASLGPE